MHQNAAPQWAFNRTQCTPIAIILKIEYTDLMKTVNLEQFQMAANIAIKNHALRNAHAKAYLQELSDAAILSVRAAVWGERLQTIRKQYPVNWIEALKDRFLPNVLKKRFPVKYETIDIDVAAVYPEYTLSKKEYGPMRVNIMDRSRITYDFGPEESEE